MLKLWNGDHDKWQVNQLFTRTCTNQTNWLMHSWNTFVHGWTMRAASKCHIVPKFLKLGLLELWRPVTSCSDLQLKRCLKKNFSPRRKISNNIWHATYTHIIQGDYWLLVVGSQIGTLTLNPSFNHNLCYKYSNGSWEPILDIYVSKVFQWYKEFFNTLKFDSLNLSLKIRNSIGIPTLKVRIDLGICGFIPSHSLTLPKV